jgi:LPS-assembly lipoprotein
MRRGLSCLSRLATRLALAPTRLTLALLLVMGVAGCGFQLRGPTTMPFASIYLGFPPTTTVRPELVRALKLAPTLVVASTPDKAEARLEVLQEVREKEILAFSSAGTPREYEIRLRFRWRLLDAQADEWIEPNEIILRRTITTTDAQLAAKPQEEVILYRDMINDLVTQLVRRLAAAPKAAGS